MQLTLTRPDDWHLHLRDDTALNAVVGHTAKTFARAVVMPNLTPPVINTELASQYRDRILQAAKAYPGFDPLMTLYLTEQLTPEEIARAGASGFIKACKLYPAGATTNSDAGVKDIQKIYPTLEAMQRANLVLCVHGEVVDPKVDIFDREAVFIDQILTPLVREFPELRVVLEHITTEQAATFITDSPETIGATVTPQHLMYNRNDMLVGGIKPHFYCLPIIKRDNHRQALVNLAMSGHPRLFLGTDSAPHARTAKESACGCAGMFSAHAAIELYAEVFEQHGALDKLEAFASFHGPDFYGLPRNADTITLEKSPWTVPETYGFGDDVLVPMKAGAELQWRVRD
ncbi:MAG TPA: dihydroorotase [Gammaproteobacteria bacterium]|nr:dihydroorotase [Gammaproteobacteria bacterium]